MSPSVVGLGLGLGLGPPEPQGGIVCAPQAELEHAPRSKSLRAPIKAQIAEIQNRIEVRISEVII